uniref:Uncharacterized protein n=1 Tax=Sphaerodactylus townsendi TaxID=933632 RepID=A0ACB8EJY8_9SAUR
MEKTQAGSSPSCLNITYYLAHGHCQSSVLSGFIPCANSQDGARYMKSLRAVGETQRVYTIQSAQPRQQPLFSNTRIIQSIGKNSITPVLWGRGRLRPPALFFMLK